MNRVKIIKMTGSLWNYYRDEPNDPLADNYDADSIKNSPKEVL